MEKSLFPYNACGFWSHCHSGTQEDYYLPLSFWCYLNSRGLCWMETFEGIILWHQKDLQKHAISSLLPWLCILPVSVLWMEMHCTNYASISNISKVIRSLWCLFFLFCIVFFKKPFHFIFKFKTNTHTFFTEISKHLKYLKNCHPN